MTLTPSHIIEYLYCPRFTYFEYVLQIPQHEEKHYKVMRGRRMHDERLERNKDYLRRKVGAVAKQTDVYLSNALLRGRVDEVLTLADGTMAPLDYKFAEYNERIYKTLHIQLCCYAWLVEGTFGVKAPKGYLVYVRSKNKLVEADTGPEQQARVRAAAEGIERVIGGNIFPKATPDKQKCVHCTYRNICVQ